MTTCKDEKGVRGKLGGSVDDVFLVPGRSGILKGLQTRRLDHEILDVVSPPLYRVRAICPLRFGAGTGVYSGMAKTLATWV
jgi:hypothetical protein